MSRIAAGPTHFVLLVPAEPPSDTLTFEESECWHAAQARANEVAQELRRLGASVEGRVGSNNPYEAVLDQLGAEMFDEIVLSTHPPGLSVWLGLDLVSRLRKATNVKVTHVIPDPIRPHVESGAHPDSDRPVGRY